MWTTAKCVCLCSFQRELVVFFRLQMATHHPHGAKTPDEGAFAVNDDMWKVPVLQLRRTFVAGAV